MHESVKQAKPLMLCGVKNMDLNMTNKQFQENGLKKRRGLKKRSKTETILIIHSDTPDHLDIKPSQIEKQDRQNGILGFKDHFVITLDGKVHQGRDREVQGFGVNQKTITIQMIGREYFTPHQMAALKKLIIELKEQYDQAKVDNRTTIEKI